jgi:copper(I)-binding protein
MTPRLLPFLVLLSLLLVACDTRAIEVEDAWGQPSVPGAANSAFYMTLTNRSGVDDTLLAASSASCRAMELHETQVDDRGAVQMRPLARGIPLPAGETVALTVDGRHVMCVGVAESLLVGDHVALTLEFAQADPVTVRATILTEPPAG